MIANNTNPAEAPLSSEISPPPEHAGPVAAPEPEIETPDRKSATGTVTRIIVFLAVGGLIFYAYRNYGDVLSLQSLASKEAELRQYQIQHPMLVYGLAFLVYVAVTGLSLPGATVLTLVFGWYFGFLRAFVLVSFASTTGATVAFLLSRYLLRDVIQNRFGDRLASFNESLRREGAFYLFTLRLIPAVPFFVINVVMGLTPIRTSTYWWVSQVGMLPGTAVYVYAGAQFPDLQTLADKGGSGILTPQLIAAFVLLGLFPLVVKQIMKRIRPAANQDSK
ncbi:MAG: TVP38/TMEM64 family protein [Fuerstiella sp.]